LPLIGLPLVRLSFLHSGLRLLPFVGSLLIASLSSSSDASFASCWWFWIA